MKRRKARKTTRPAKRKDNSNRNSNIFTAVLFILAVLSIFLLKIQSLLYVFLPMAIAFSSAFGYYASKGKWRYAFASSTGVAAALLYNYGSFLPYWIYASAWGIFGAVVIHSLFGRWIRQHKAGIIYALNLTTFATIILKLPRIPTFNFYIWLILILILIVIALKNASSIIAAASAAVLITVMVLIFTPIYITYDANGGSFASGSENYISQTAYGAEVDNSDIEIPVREGYEFYAWRIAGGIITRSITNNALWEVQQFNITYNANGGSFADGSDTLTVTEDYNSELGSVEQPIRTGHIFAGWDIDSNIVTGDAEINALWEVEQFVITYNANGGSFTDGSGTLTVTYDYAEELDNSLIEIPTREGYSFSTWDIVGGYVGEDKTINAVWEELTVLQQSTLNISGRFSRVNTFEGTLAAPTNSQKVFENYNNVYNEFSLTTSFNYWLSVNTSTLITINHVLFSLTAGSFFNIEGCTIYFDGSLLYIYDFTVTTITLDIFLSI
jgi:hypothetical protein